MLALTEFHNRLCQEARKTRNVANKNSYHCNCCSDHWKRERERERERASNPVRSKYQFLYNFVVANILYIKIKLGAREEMKSKERYMKFKMEGAIDAFVKLLY